MLRITIKSMINRRLTSFLCILSIALSVTLLIGIERVRVGAKDGFTSTISQADLIVGAKGGKLQLLLYTIFHMGGPVNNIRYSSLEKISKDPRVDWTIPISLGDSFKGHRVIGTNESLFINYRYRGDQKLEFREGKTFEKTYDVVIGGLTARKLNLSIGDNISIVHGMQLESAYSHDDTPFKVVGILKDSGTPMDSALFITLEGMEAIHIGWETGVPEEVSFDKKTLKRDQVKVTQLTAFIIGTKSRIHLFRLRSTIDKFTGEPLMGIIPGLVLSDLWQIVSQVENLLLLISICVLIVGLLGITISLYTSLNERRREVAILRSLGIRKRNVFLLLFYESIILVLAGIVMGIAFLWTIQIIFGPYIQNNYNLFLDFKLISMNEAMYLVCIFSAGILSGIIPSMKAYANSLHDGLTIKN